RIQEVLAHSLAKRITANYSAAVRAFHDFCTANKFSPLPTSEFVLCAYTAYLAASIAGSSIANTLSGIHSWHVMTNKMWRGSLLLQLVIKGVTNLTPESPNVPVCTLVTMAMLGILARCLNPDSAEHRAILAAATVTFWGPCCPGVTTRLKADL
ncbi:hypothetical protein BDV93DRAFT_454683, partial [Ceratobasidium sp. AG-I]